MNVKGVRRRQKNDEYFTLPEVYSLISDYVRDRYFPKGGFDGLQIVRPFYPGGDYEHAEYPENCLVLDNPPFSIITPIVKFYQSRGIRFFLFCSGIGITNVAKNCQGVTRIAMKEHLLYQNGYTINTGFCTNLPDPEIGMPFLRTDPKLRMALRRATATRTLKIREYPKRPFPTHCVMEKHFHRACVDGVEVAVYPEDIASTIRKPDTVGSVIYMKEGRVPRLFTPGATLDKSA